MTIAAARRAQLKGVPVQLCGSTATRLYDQGHEYTRISEIYPCRDKNVNNYFIAVIVDDYTGVRSSTYLHCDLKDIKVADSVPEEIRREIYKE